jgi:protein-tyrosine phosphatase
VSSIIDFHSHILPGADHGSSGIRTSLKQVSMIDNAGVDTVVATPHFYPNVIDSEDFLRMVDSTAEELRSSLKDSRVKICLGAEVLYCDGLESMDHIEKLCIRGTRVLLLELPMEDKWSDRLFYCVKTLAKTYTVVLAHIDRYIRSHKSDIEELLALGAYAQINAYSFASMGMRHKLASFLEGERVVALGSDLHGADEKSYERFLASRKRLGENFDRIMARTKALLDGAEYLE